MPEKKFETRKNDSKIFVNKIKHQGILSDLLPSDHFYEKQGGVVLRWEKRKNNIKEEKDMGGFSKTSKSMNVVKVRV